MAKKDPLVPKTPRKPKEPNRRVTHERAVKAAAESYTITLFMGTNGWFKQEGLKTLEEAIEAANVVVRNEKMNVPPNVRPANIYAVATKYEHFALVGTVSVTRGFVPVVEGK